MIQIYFSVNKVCLNSPHFISISQLISTFLLDSKENWNSALSNWQMTSYADPTVPAVTDIQTPVWPTNYSTSESHSPPNLRDAFSSSGNEQSFQSEWNSTNFSVNHDYLQTQPFNNYPSGFHVDEQQHSYCNSWEYSHLFYPSISNNSFHCIQNYPCDNSNSSPNCYTQTSSGCNPDY